MLQNIDAKKIRQEPTLTGGKDALTRFTIVIKGLTEFCNSMSSFNMISFPFPFIISEFVSTRACFDYCRFSFKTSSIYRKVSDLLDLHPCSLFKTKINLYFSELGSSENKSRKISFSSFRTMCYFRKS